MANIKSAEKRARIAEKNRLRNKAYKSAMKTKIKNFEQALNTDDQGAAEAQLKEVSRYLDKLVSKNIIHKKLAARKKSRLYKKLKITAS